ncbi:DUF4123 domain-containing protein [Caldimonas aquatica]|uniref:DUF4123 domain-containing protein n=1 Tax=Caldimonas aquatica TaxID=376175 RepID=A0ABY6MX12_9BURK|nr:DUF4123 domain-containing protein [Schlegelella aquatica]UZD56511.1 DUF4123 domain-containing protein [Schlegelella aquatica]
MAQAVFHRLGETGPEALAVSPCVVAHRPHDAALRDVLHQCSARPMVTAVVTSESADQLADRLARWAIVNATGSLFHLRFADTRRLPAIARALQPEQLADFIGPALQWRCIGRDGRWHELPRVAVEPTALTANSIEAPPLDDAQFAALVQDSEADGLLAALERDLPHVWQRTRPSWRHRHAREALREADRRGERDTPARLARVREALRRTGASSASHLEGTSCPHQDPCASS